MTEVATPVETGTEASATITPTEADSGSQIVLPLGLAEFEQLVRRIVREEVGRLLQAPQPSILDDWSHEGPDDPAGDEELLQDALAAIRERKEHPGSTMSWEECKAELRRAEAAGELPD